MFFLTSLGEVMLRLSPPGHERLRTATSLDVRMCGAQFNVAADLALLGKCTAFISKLPASELGMLARAAAKGYGIDMSHVQEAPDTRMGVIYVEFGADPRPGIHLYDRKGSAASTIRPADFDWKAITKATRFAYTDGIFPGLNSGCREATLEFLKAARAVRCETCFDMNYRETLASPEEARKLYGEVLRFADVLVANQSVASLMFGVQDTEEGFAQRFHQEFGCRIVLMTSREMRGGQRGQWRSMALFEKHVEYGGPQEFEVVDRYGTGDAFLAGFLFGYAERGVKYGLDFGNTLCALAHTTHGDVISSSSREVDQLLAGGVHFDVKR
jgi:2-dehydro-3-deoxygluconokinase